MFQYYSFKIQNLLYILGILINTVLVILFSYGISYFLQEILSNGGHENLNHWGMMMLILSIIIGFWKTIIAQYLPLRFQLKKSIHISQDVVKNILELNQDCYIKNEKGYYINLVTNSALTYGTIYKHLWIELIANAICVLVVISIAGYINLYLGIAMCFYIPICYLITHVASKKIAEFQKKGLSTQDAFLTYTKKIIESKREINILKANVFWINYYKKISNRYLKFVEKYRFFEALSNNLPSVLAQCYQIGILIFSIYMLKQGNITVASILLIYQLIPYYNGVVSRVFEIIIHYKINKVHLERVHTVIDQSKETSGFEKLYHLNNENLVEAEHFSLFAGKEKLFHIDKLEIKKNSVTIIKGENGSGKSMFVNYLMGYGNMEENLFNYPLKKSIDKKLNINFSNKNIEDTPINLSFGEQQKLNLLRVFSREENVYIFDEPFTNLDQDTQQNVVELIKELKGKASVFVIMHSDELDGISDYILKIEDKTMKIVDKSNSIDAKI